MIVNRGVTEGAGSIDPQIQKQDIVITKEVIREIMKFGDEANHPTSFVKDKVMPILQRMSYEGEYPPMLNKRLRPY
ncbi:hypothetical protein Hanom_Chr03g00202831 [Helianthus anomalus]